MQPWVADFFQNCNLDLLESFNRSDRPQEALQGEDFITETSNSATFALGDTRLHTDVPQPLQRDVIIILSRRTGDPSSKTVLSVDQLCYQWGEFLLAVCLLLSYQTV